MSPLCSTLKQSYFLITQNTQQYLTFLLDLEKKLFFLITQNTHFYMILQKIYILSNIKYSIIFHFYLYLEKNTFFLITQNTLEYSNYILYLEKKKFF